MLGQASKNYHMMLLWVQWSFYNEGAFYPTDFFEFSGALICAKEKHNPTHILFTSFTPIIGIFFTV